MSTLRPDGRLPSEETAYWLADGEGERYLLGGELHIVKATSASTGGKVGIVEVSGAFGHPPLMHSHGKSTEGVYVLSGRAQLFFGDQSRVLAPGDFASLPPGTPHSLILDGPRSRAYVWHTPAGPEGIVHLVGEPTEARVAPEESSEADVIAAIEAHASDVDTELHPDMELAQPVDGADDTLPSDGATPYVLRRGEGMRQVGGPTFNTFLQRQQTTDGGAAALVCNYMPMPFIYQHHHFLHTETFIMLAGRGRWFINGDIIALTPGDIAIVPPRTNHAFAIDSPDTRFMGVLTPGVFEGFFDMTSEPTDSYVWYPSNFDFAAGLGKVQESQLDQELLGPPPDDVQVPLTLRQSPSVAH